jgi:hypothetical protein
MVNLRRRYLPLALQALSLLPLAACGRGRADAPTTDTTSSRRSVGHVVAKPPSAAPLAGNVAADAGHDSRPGDWTVFQEGENQVSEQVDLDGDGRPEQITLAVDRESSHFTLSVNGARAAGESVEEIDDPELGVVDLDKGDRARELIVYAQGASDYDDYFIYAYDGHALKKLGELHNAVSYTGNGILLNFEWMGFWSREEKYTYDGAARALRHVPQELHYVGVSGTVGKSFPIYRTRGGRDVVANLKEGSHAQILACEVRDCGDDDDSCLWYLIRSESGLLGWKQGIDTDDFTDLPWAG